MEQTTVESVEIEDVEVVGDRNPLEKAVDSATPAKIEKPVQAPKKSGRKLPGETKKLVEKNLLPGQKVKAKELAKLIEITEQGINLCKTAKKLHEWGLKLVPNSKPQEYERI